MDYRAYLGGLVHLHTKLSNYRGHHESDQTVRTMTRFLLDAGLVGPGAPWQYLVITNHVSNPAAPRPLGALSLRARLLRRQQWARRQLGVEVLYGFEASILRGGRTDLTPRLERAAELVIGSAHGNLEGVREDPAAYTALLEQACTDASLDALGHPQRALSPEVAARVDWAAVFAVAARTGTAIEVNLNSLRAASAAAWLEALARSGAQILLGYDLHNQIQLDRIRHDWQTIAAPDGPNRLREGLDAIHAAGIGPERIVNRSLADFTAWIHTSKAGRS